MFKHKKKLGQNFLINKEIIKKIADIGDVAVDCQVTSCDIASCADSI